MLTLRPIDPVAIEKRLESPDALVISASASTIDGADVDELPPRGRVQQEETSPASSAHRVRVGDPTP